MQSEDPELVQKAADDLLDRQRDIAKYFAANRKHVQQMELEGYRRVVDPFRDKANPEQIDLLDGIYESARRAIDRGSNEYENLLQEYRVRSYRILQTISEFLISQFQARVQNPQDYQDPQQFARLKAEGLTCIENEDTGKLRDIIHQLDLLQKPDLTPDIEKMYDPVNVMRG